MHLSRFSGALREREQWANMPRELDSLLNLVSNFLHLSQNILSKIPRMGLRIYINLQEFLAKASKTWPMYPGKCI